MTELTMPQSQQAPVDNSFFNKKKCDASRGKNSWTVVELKQLCTQLKIDYKSNDLKEVLCHKLSRHFKKASDTVTSVSSVIGSPTLRDTSGDTNTSELFNSESQPIATLPQIATLPTIQAPMTPNIFNQKKCDASRGKNSWTVVDLKQLCVQLKIDYKSNDKKEDLCKKISKHFKKSSEISSVMGSPTSQATNTSEIFIDNSGSNQTMLSSKTLSDKKFNFISKRCDSTRGGKNSWSIVDLRSLCVDLQLGISVDRKSHLSEKEQLCKRISEYFQNVSFDKLPGDEFKSLLSGANDEADQKAARELKLKLDRENMTQSKSINGVLSLEENYINKLKQKFAFTNCTYIPVHELYETCTRLQVEYTSSDTKLDLCNKIKAKLFKGKVTSDCNRYNIQELQEMAQVLGIIVAPEMSQNDLCNQITSKLNVQQKPQPIQSKLMDFPVLETAKQMMSNLFVAKPFLDENVDTLNYDDYTYSQLRKKAKELGIQDNFDLPQDLFNKIKNKLIENKQQNKSPVVNDHVNDKSELTVSDISDVSDSELPNYDTTELTIEQPEISNHLENRIQEIINNENENEKGSVDLDHSLKKIETLNNDMDEVTLDLDNLDTLNLDDLDLDSDNDDAVHDVSHALL